MDACKYYLALDLELNNAKDGSTPNPKIIQVGVSWGTWDHYVDGSMFKKSWYIDPQEPIYPEITQLTGITDGHITRWSVDHETVAAEIEEIVKQYDCFINPITWGGGDSSILIQEFKDRNVEFHAFGRRWIDIKTWYVYNQLAKGLSLTGGLSKAMPKYGIQFKGIPHIADDDAYNTLRLFFAMIDRQSKLEYLLKIAKDIK